MRQTAVAWDPDLAHEVLPAKIVPGTETAIHLQSLAISNALSRYYVKNFITPEAVVDVLNAAGVRFMLAGAHAISGWTNEPRATDDVDVLVATRHVRAAVRALQKAYPRLELRDMPVVARFVDPRTGKVVLDVMKPNQPLFRDALRLRPPDRDREALVLRSGFGVHARNEVRGDGKPASRPTEEDARRCRFRPYGASESRRQPGQARQARRAHLS